MVLVLIVLVLVAPALHPATLCPSTPQPSTSPGSSAQQLQLQLHSLQLHFIWIGLILWKEAPQRGGLGVCGILVLGEVPPGRDEQCCQHRAEILLDTLVRLISERQGVVFWVAMQE